jgi:hypothetical protein
MHRLRSVLLAASLVVPAAALAQPADVTGVVFVDTNANGVRDAGEQGLAHVIVSNQDAVVATDASGAFRLPRLADGVLFVSVPDGYRAVGAFWRPVDDAKATVDFPLTPVRRVTAFTFIHASDPHIAPAVVQRMQRFRTLADSLHPALFKSPLWTVPGNHENFGIERDKSHVSPANPLYGRQMYHHYLGPDYYSFTFGGVHFVGLNTVDIDDQSYYGHVDSRQLAWLERDLAMVPPQMPVVTFDHIPFFSSFEALGGYTDAPPAPTLITVQGKRAFRHTVSNAAAVLEVLRTHRHVLALGGHIHASEQIVYQVDGVETRFNQTAAIVGPNAGAGMRFVSGFTVYTVRDGVMDAGRFIPLGIDKEK